MTMTDIGNTRPRVTIYSDGACSPNPGIGGWAAVLIGEDGRRREIWGAAPETTSERMELTGAIEGLRALERPSDVTLHTDWTTVCNAFTNGWVIRWRARRWRSRARKPVENADLWLQLVELTAVHRVEWQWVPAHAGIKENVRCDKLAVRARKRLQAQLRQLKGSSAAAAALSPEPGGKAESTR